MNFRQVDSLYEGSQVTIVRNTNQWMNGYPWFEIHYTNHLGKRFGYQWGGIMCGLNETVPGLHRTCPYNAGQNGSRNQGHSRGNNQGGVAVRTGTTGAGGAILTRTVRFAPGTSSSNLSGGFARGEREVFRLGASGGQVMHLDIHSVENNAAFSVYADSANGSLLGRSGPSGQWTGTLPYQTTYFVVVESLRGGTSYNLFMEIR